MRLAMLRYRVRVCDLVGRPRFTADDDVVARLLALCWLANPGDWELQLDPPLAAALTVTADTVVVPTMTVLLRPRPRPA